MSAGSPPFKNEEHNSEIASTADRAMIPTLTSDRVNINDCLRTAKEFYLKELWKAFSENELHLCTKDASLVFFAVSSKVNVGWVFFVRWWKSARTMSKMRAFTAKTGYRKFGFSKR